MMREIGCAGANAVGQDQERLLLICSQKESLACLRHGLAGRSAAGQNGQHCGGQSGGLIKAG
jgi:hypothetical protein